MTTVTKPKDSALNTLHVFKNMSDFLSNQQQLDGARLALVGNVEIVKVGGIYISTKPDNPASLFGGEWKPLDEGRVLVSAGASYPLGSKGGSSSVSLSTSHLPSHDHYISVSSASTHSHSSSYGEQGFDPAADWNSPGNADSRGSSPAARSSTNGSHSHSLSIGYAGGSSSHNNMMPYLAVYMWQRLA